MDTGDKLLLSMKSELDLINELIKYVDGQGDKAEMADVMMRARLVTLGNSLARVINRVEHDVEYRLGVKDGQVTVLRD